MTLDELAAHMEIRQTLARYCRGVDRGDPDVLLSVYHEGAIDNHGAFNGSGSEFAAMLIQAMDASPVVGQHHITNVLVELEGDAANVESYYVAWHPVPSATEGEWDLVMVGGRYLDRFENRADQWKIVHRQVLMDWSNEPVPAGGWAGAGMFPAGGRREADPSANFFSGHLVTAAD